MSTKRAGWMRFNVFSELGDDWPKSRCPSQSRPAMRKLDSNMKSLEPIYVDPGQALLITLTKAEEFLSE